MPGARHGFAGEVATLPEVAREVAELRRGLATGAATLRAGTTATVLASPAFGPGTVLVLAPRDPAAAGLAWRVAAKRKGAIELAHDAPAADAGFDYIALG